VTEEEDSSPMDSPCYAGLRLEDAEAVLIGILRSSGRREELAECLEQRLARQPDAPDEWLELGQLREEALHQPSRAAEAYREVLKTWPDSKIALRGMRRVSERLGEWEDLVEVLETERELLADSSSEEAAGYWRRIGDLCWNKLQSTTRASRAFAAALEASPGDLESLHSLQALFEAMEDWRGAIDLYRSEIDVLGDRAQDRSRELLLHIASIAQEHTHELDRARRAFESANKLAPLSPEQNAELALIYEEEGNLERFAELYTLFCDSSSDAVCSDNHLRLGHALRKLERSEEALARYHSALECESERNNESQLALIWVTIAEVCSELNKAEDAAVAHAEAAQYQAPEEAAEELQRAALGIEDIDLGRASQWLQEAMACNPASAAPCAHLTRVCNELEDFEAASTAAVRAMELSNSHERLPDELAVATASTGAMAAYRAEDPSTACLLYKQAVDLDASQHDLQASYATVLFELGEIETARATLETLLTYSLSDPQRGEALALLGSCLEHDDDCEQAQERYLAAIDCDPRNQRATEGLLCLFEKSGQVDEAMALLDRLEECADDSDHRARIHLQAAKINIREGAEAHCIIDRLRNSIAATPCYPEAWTLLVDQLVASGTPEELTTTANAALEHVRDPQDRGVLAHCSGQGLEAMDHLPQAAEAYSLAQQEDPSRVSDVLKCAHLLRALGEWQEAARILDRAGETAPPSVPPSLRSQLFLHLARLLAGPLEDIGSATNAYRAALDCHPDLLEAQEGLALILVHQPDAWKEAVKRNRAILLENPSRVASLHAVMKVLRQRKKRTGEEDGAALLGALGVAPPSQQDKDEKPPAFSIRISGKTELSDPLWETARKVLHATKEEIAQALKVRNQGTESFENESEPQARFRVAALNAEGELTAPALVPVSNTEVMTILRLICDFALGSEQVEGDGALVNAFAANLSRRAQRRVKRILGATTIEDIETIDISLWRREVRDLANACALDSTEGDLWSALRVLVRDNHPDGDRLDLTGNIQELVQGTATANALQTRAIHAWLDSISLR
ncbi:MAG: tetratricopeptide repeat protein, partial [Deltaproteobacteria bacterium]|nr:tetratricopeptide repeat protein [Deltaproteobacteria bacterium]